MLPYKENLLSVRAKNGLRMLSMRKKTISSCSVCAENHNFFKVLRQTKIPKEEKILKIVFGDLKMG